MFPWVVGLFGVPTTSFRPILARCAINLRLESAIGFGLPLFPAPAFVSY